MESKIKWKDFFLKELFDVEKGTRLIELERMKGNTPFVRHMEQFINFFLWIKSIDYFYMFCYTH